MPALEALWGISDLDIVDRSPLVLRYEVQFQNHHAMVKSNKQELQGEQELVKSLQSGLG